MNKLLLITVGTGRDGKDIAHGILYSIQVNNPSYILFIVTKESINRTIPFIINEIEISSEQIEINEIDDVEILYEKYCNLIQSYLNKGYKEKDITIDYTSGTKAMSAAIVCSAFTMKINTLSYIYGKRAEDGRVIPGTERINSLSPNLFITENKIRLFIEFFNINQFDNAIKIFDNEENFHYKYNNLINNLLKLAFSYSQWDKFNFKVAHERMEEIDKKLLSNYSNIIPKHIAFNISWAKNLILSNGINNFHIAELYYNSQRRYYESKYDDGVARLYRVIEMIAQKELYDSYGIETSHFEKSKIPEPIREEFNIDKIALLDAYKLLYKLDNPLGQKFMDSFQEILKILASRNNSILAHGLQPIKKEQYEKLSEIAKTFIDFPKQEGYKFVELSITDYIK